VPRRSVGVVLRTLELRLIRFTLSQALDHPYFFALPNPTHPSKLPKPPSTQSSRPLDELDGNVEPSSSGPGVKAVGPNKRKRKLSGGGRGGKADRMVSRKLDFGSISNGSS